MAKSQLFGWSSLNCWYLYSISSCIGYLQANEVIIHGNGSLRKYQIFFAFLSVSIFCINWQSLKKIHRFLAQSFVQTCKQSSSLLVFIIFQKICLASRAVLSSMPKNFTPDPLELVVGLLTSNLTPRYYHHIHFPKAERC